ncbi:hypothetical protein H2201_003824 [Coniosporium apollinis]|uniref:Transmembrane protein n=1 Tax=Coniosporium apollinis TaxID=61459 RepID=A0ABQ9NWT3_9PEZI|nr:hypothetical protein H2201_003824 [Coniosporium apollinis]
MSRTSFLSLATALILQLLTLVPATEAKKSKSGGIDVEEENLGGRIAPPTRLILALFSIFLVLQVLSLIPTVEAAKKGKGSGGGVEEEAAAVRISGSGIVFLVMAAVAAAATAGAAVW